MGPEARLSELAKITDAPTPVVSVYLDTRWTDEQQRERVRVFVKTEVRKAREGGADAALDQDLDWIEAEVASIVRERPFPDAQGVALFACRGLGLREVLPLRAAFENVLVVAEAPFLRPLAARLDETPAALVVFVDGESARLIPLAADGGSQEVALEHEVPGHHRRGGWALLAQSRYQRHIQDHRDRHFEAVVHALADLAEGRGLERIVLAGEPRTLAAFRRHLPPRLAERIAGHVTGSRREPASAIVARAVDLVARRQQEEERAAVEAALTEAAKGGRAVAGPEETLEAVARGAVHRLFLLEGFREDGRLCVACGGLQRGDDASCRRCGEPTRASELGEAIVDRVIATGGTVHAVADHPGLTRAGGVAALLRYPL